MRRTGRCSPPESHEVLQQCIRILSPGPIPGRGQPPKERWQQSNRVDNGREFISRDLDLWGCPNNFRLDFSRPGKPTGNSFIEAAPGREPERTPVHEPCRGLRNAVGMTWTPRRGPSPKRDQARRHVPAELNSDPLCAGFAHFCLRPAKNSTSIVYGLSIDGIYSGTHDPRPYPCSLTYS